MRHMREETHEGREGMCRGRDVQGKRRVKEGTHEGRDTQGKRCTREEMGSFPILSL